MRGLGFVLTAVVGCAAAVDQCTPDDSGSCCQGYTYNDNPLQKRTTAPVCDGTSIEPAPGQHPPTCPADSSGNSIKPVCIATETIPSGSYQATLYCGNPLANTGSGTVTGSLVVEVVQCPGSTEFCFQLTATPPSGTTFDDDFKIQISTSELTSDISGHFAVHVGSTLQPVYYPSSLVYGSTGPCDPNGLKTVWIGFHTGEGGQTCWAAGPNPKTPPSAIIGGGNRNWALQFSFDITCKDVCTCWCCCPPPPTIPECPADYSQSCPGLCSPPKANAQCNLLNIDNPPGWTTNLYFAQKCCCKPPDTPQCPSGEVQHILSPGVDTCCAFSGDCGNPLIGTIADCNTGNFNEVCCCCTPSTQCSPGTHIPGACSGTPPPGQTCTRQSDGCGGQICCCQSSATCNTETAFAVPAECHSGSVCSINTLSSAGCGPNRWGWYIMTGDLSKGLPAAYALYAGAAQNDLLKGTQVGSVQIVQCTGGWCAIFTTTTSSYVIVDAHVEADCGTSLTPNGRPNFPCAPGRYNDNSGGTCGPSNGLPSTSWQSEAFMPCSSNQYVVIFHAAVAPNDGSCCASNCGSS